MLISNECCPIHSNCFLVGDWSESQELSILSWILSDKLYCQFKNKIIVLYEPIRFDEIVIFNINRQNVHKDPGR